MPAPEVFDAVAVKTTLAPVHKVVPDEVKTILGLVTLKVNVLEPATVDERQVPPVTVILHLILAPFDIVELV